jgi:hypothetical protein
LIDSVKDWRTEWFYTSNMSPPLAVHSDAGPVVNDRWEKAPLTVEELKKIKPLLEKIKTLKQKGLTDFGIMASYIRHQVQPLRARETYGFEYIGAVGYQNTRVPNRRQNMAPCTIAKAPS